MTKKNIFIIIVITLLIAAGVVGYSTKKDRLFFKLCNIDLPQEKLISQGKPGTFNSFRCNDSSKPKLIMKCYDSGRKEDVEGGWAYKYILQCEEGCYVVDGAEMYGERIYGPF